MKKTEGPKSRDTVPLSENHNSKNSPFFCHLLGDLLKIRPQIFSAANIFLGPLLRFAAKISAGWQH
jgi:hypothetical protein